jgi:hypothetical protein
MTYQDIAAAAAPYVLIVATALFAWLSAAIVRLINAHVRNATVRGVLERLNTEVSIAVAEVAQTSVATLKGASADRKLTQDEAAGALDEAKSKALAYLGTEGIEALERVLGPVDVEAYVVARIEAAIGKSKGTP